MDSPQQRTVCMDVPVSQPQCRVPLCPKHCQGRIFVPTILSASPSVISHSQRNCSQASMLHRIPLWNLTILDDHGRDGVDRSLNAPWITPLCAPDATNKNFHLEQTKTQTLRTYQTWTFIADVFRYGCVEKFTFSRCGTEIQFSIQGELWKAQKSSVHLSLLQEWEVIKSKHFQFHCITRDFI